MKFLSICLILLLSATPSFAADPDSAAGVYKYRFTNVMTVDESEYQSENILEIVTYDANTVYFRTDLAFANGHSCFLYGMAKTTSKGFLHEQEACRLTIAVAANGEITYEDPDGKCRAISCGMRGEYDAITFTPAQKRPIRYMKRLKNSIYYRAAVKAHEEHIPLDKAFGQLQVEVDAGKTN